MTQVNKKDLLKLLANCKSIVSTRSTMPILSNVLLTIEPRGLTIQCTDLEIVLTQTMQAVGNDAFKLLLPYKLLTDVVKSCTDIIDIREQSTFNDVTIPTLEPMTWPVMPVVTGDVFTMSFDNLDKVLYATSEDVTRYHLNGVHIDKTYFVATDGRRMVKVEHGSNLPVLGFILPTKGLKLVSKLFSGPVNCVTNGQYLLITTDKVQLLIRKIDGKYPNYNQFIPAKFKHTITLSRLELLGHIKSLLPLTPKLSHGGVLGFTKGQLQLKNNPDIEWDKSDKKNHVEKSRGPVVAKSMTSDYSQDETFNIGFNLSYLVDALESLDSDTVIFQMNDKFSPIDIKSSKQSTHNNIVMPMRI